MASARFLRSEPKSKIYDGAAFCCAVSFYRIACGKFSFIAIFQERRAKNCAPLLSFPNRAAYGSVFVFPAAKILSIYSLLRLNFIRPRHAKNFSAPRFFPTFLKQEVCAYFMRGLPAVSMSLKNLSSSKIHLNCKLFSRSHHLRNAAGLSSENVVRSKKFCSVRHFYLHIKAAARYPRGCRFFTSFYAPLSGNKIHKNQAP